MRACVCVYTVGVPLSVYGTSHGEYVCVACRSMCVYVCMCAYVLASACVRAGVFVQYGVP